jgi:ribosome-associated protein
MRQDEQKREAARKRAGAKRATKGASKDASKDAAAQQEQQPGPQQQPAGGAMDDSRIVAALRAAGEKKAVEPLVLDLRELASFTDYFLIASGTNARQVQAIADEVVERLKREGTRAERVEGYRTAEWVLLDYGDFIFHIFEDKARRFYDLERLWRDAARVELPAELQREIGGGPAPQA